MAKESCKSILNKIGIKVKGGRKWFLVDQFGQLICFNQKNLNTMFPNNYSLPLSFFIFMGMFWLGSLVTSIVYLYYPGIVVDVVLFLIVLYRTDTQRSLLYEVVNENKCEIKALISFLDKSTDSSGCLNSSSADLKILLDFIMGKDDVYGKYLPALGLLFKVINTRE